MLDGDTRSPALPRRPRLLESPTYPLRSRIRPLRCQQRPLQSAGHYLLARILLFLIRKGDFHASISLFLIGNCQFLVRILLFLIRKSDFLASILLFLIGNCQFLVGILLFLIRKRDFLNVQLKTAPPAEKRWYADFFRPGCF